MDKTVEEEINYEEKFLKLKPYLPKAKDKKEITTEGCWQKTEIINEIDAQEWCNPYTIIYEPTSQTKGGKE